MMVSDKQVLVTGGGGFIGSHLVDALAQENQVIVVDDFSSGSRENLRQHERAGNVRIVEGDICDGALMREVTGGVDIVYHLATRCLRLSINNPEPVHHVNATGALRVGQAALDNRVKRLVYVSSSEVYGTAQTVPMSETHPCEPRTIYGASKLTGELYARAFYHTHGLPVVVVRPFNTYGPRAHFEGVYGEAIPRFVVRVLNGLPPVIFGDGGQTRDFTYVSDIVRGILLASASDDLVGQVVNIACGQEISIARIAQLILEILERPDLVPLYQADRPGDVRRHFADISLARARLGFQPEVDIEAGLRMYIDWFKTTYPNPQECLRKVEVRNW
jgi:UDP-glucose 4-epimerase